MGEDNLFMYNPSFYNFLKRKKSPLFSQESSQLTGNDLYLTPPTISQSLIDEADTFNSKFENPNITLGEWKFPEVKRLDGGIGNIGNSDPFNAYNSTAAPTKLEDVQDTLKPNSITAPTTTNNPAISSGVMKGIGMASDFLGGFIQKSEYSGENGGITRTLDSTYDTIANGVAVIPGWGTLLSVGLKGASLLGKGLNKIGGGTDAMTKADAFLGSSFFNLTPVGMINGFGGKRTQSFEKSREAYELLGGDYQGTEHLADNALSKSNKKYGLFSSNARHKANSLINKAKNQQSILNQIYDDTKDTFDIREGMYSINELNRRFNLQGGYDQTSVRVAKKGAKLEPVISEEDVEFVIDEESVEFIIEEENIPEFEEGGVLNKPRSIKELIEYAKQQNPRFIQRLSEDPKGIDFIDDEGNQAKGSHYLESRGEYVIPRIQEIDGELKFLNPQIALDRAIEKGNYLKMLPEEAILFAKEYKQGWPNFFQKFKKGGSFNLIPEGALHARLHHMDIDGITKKGIPVISEEDGVIEQHAEIEHSEIIYRLEVTEKLEKLMKQYEETNDDQYAIEAGKLLVKETLYNTDDKTNLINEVNT